MQFSIQNVVGAAPSGRPWLWLTTPFILLLTVAILACDGKQDDPATVILAADPPSLLQGQSVTMMLSTLEDFFDEELELPLTSAGGLVFQELVVDSHTKAIATFTSDESTEIGPHRFEIDQGGRHGVLDISVMAEQPGPGTIKAEGNKATAGARNAILTLLGKGTKLDSDCEVEVEGADGFTIDSVNVKTERRIIVTYSISLDQEPTAATVVVLDGVKRYEVPFEIVSAKEFENRAEDQRLVKGRVGWITLTHPSAEMGQFTRFVEEDNTETGIADVIDQTEVRIPVRVPFDYKGDSLTLTAGTFESGGAYYELMTTDVMLLEPAYIAITPSVLSLSSGEQQVALRAQGIDLTALESLTLADNEQLSLSDWEATTASEGTATFVVEPGAEPGSHLLYADDGFRQAVGVVGLHKSIGYAIKKSEEELKIGDHIYLSFVFQGSDLVEGEYELSGADGVEVVGLTHIDEGGFVAELAADNDTHEGLRKLNLNVGDKDYDVFVSVTESGL
ncbi:MAG: hypothetical protein GY847_36245 [Proteobacteria bacterium]|nr:hypothetical protein [Pseudomonadota bacterium]